jgi:hypothetical protein
MALAVARPQDLRAVIRVVIRALRRPHRRADQQLGNIANERCGQLHRSFRFRHTVDVHLSFDMDQNVSFIVNLNINPRRRWWS